MRNEVESLLEDDHTSLDELLAKLDANLAQHDFSRSVELLDLFWARLAMHIRAEHLHLFPVVTETLSQLAGTSSLPTTEEVSEVIARLRSDHDFFMKELGDMMKSARAVPLDAAVGEDFEARLSIIRKRLETHNQIEEQQIYLWPSLIHDRERLAELKQNLQKELANLPPRFVS
jgi:hemerythrin superfamily protein